MPLLQNQFKFFSVLKCLLYLFKFQYTATNKNKSVGIWNCKRHKKYQDDHIEKLFEVSREFRNEYKKLPADFTIINPLERGIFVPVNFSGYEEGRCEKS